MASGECSLADVMVEGPMGIKIVPASSGIRSMVSLTVAEHAGLIQAFSEIDKELDVLIVDTAAGISMPSPVLYRQLRKCWWWYAMDRPQLPMPTR